MDFILLANGLFWQWGALLHRLVQDRLCWLGDPDRRPVCQCPAPALLHRRACCHYCSCAQTSLGSPVFRKHASVPHLWKSLSLWVLVGVLAGYFALGHVNDLEVKRMIGGILLALVLLHIWRKRQGDDLASLIPHTWWFAALTGILAGFTTMVANAAGPIMVLYLLAVGLPKLNLVGTGAWFFLLVNAFPKSLQPAHLGLITRSSLEMDAWLADSLVAGSILLGPVILRKLNQAAFETVLLILTALASLRLLF